MALTLYKQPQELTPAYNKQLFTLVSDQVAITDFKYIVSIAVNGEAPLVKDYLPRPDGWLVFDSMEWVQNYIKHFFNPTLSLLSPIEIATGKTVAVEVTIGEYYTGATHDVETINYQAFDACLTDKDFKVYNFEDYLFNQTPGKYFLSKTDTTIFPDSRVELNQDVWLHFINNQTTPIDEIVIRLRRGASVISTVTIASLPTPVNTYDTYVFRVNSYCFFPVVAAYGDVMQIDFLNASSIVLRLPVTIQEVLTRFSKKTLYYLDRDGNKPFLHFEKISKNNYSKKTNSVTLSAETLNTTTGEYKSNTWDREDSIVSTAIETTMTLNTDWLTELQSAQLRDLWDSPLVWLWDGEDLISVNPPKGNYEEFKSENEALFQYSVTLDLGTIETRQRGI